MKKLLEEIANEIQDAGRNRAKTTTIHYLVFVNADVIADLGPEGFCAAVNIEDSWADEVRKMISLSNLIRERGEFELRRV